LQITSATKRSGKTRLLETLEPVVSRPWFTGRTSAAALVRKVDAECPTLLLDESDAAFGGDKDYAEALRGILNSGYRRSGRCTVCIGQGGNIQARDFSTFSPKAIAGIGQLPDTIADRSIAIQLRRRSTDEPCARWRERDGHLEAVPFRDALAVWALEHIEALRAARPSLPDGLNDRTADVWEPLLAIADLAGGSWPATARAVALELAGTLPDTDITIELLRDVQTFLCDYPTSRDVVPTKALLETLTALEDRPWASWRHDRPMTARGLARLLEPLGVHVDRYTVDGVKVRGYRRDAFDDAIARYLPVHVAMRTSANKTGAELAFSIRPATIGEATSKTAKTSIKTGVGPHGHIETRDEGVRDVDGRF
jgi:hypothetical protein